jgi:hypothetical protein
MNDSNPLTNTEAKELNEFNFTCTDPSTDNLRDSQKYLPKNIGDILSAAAGVQEDSSGSSAQNSLHPIRQSWQSKKRKGAKEGGGSAYRSSERLPISTMPMRNDQLSKSGGTNESFSNFFSGGRREEHKESVRSGESRIEMNGSPNSSKKPSSIEVSMTASAANMPQPSMQSAIYSLGGMPMNIQNTEVSAKKSSKHPKRKSIENPSSFKNRSPSIESSSGLSRTSVVDSIRGRASAGAILFAEDNSDAKSVHQSISILNSPQRRNIVNAVSHQDLRMLNDGFEESGMKRSFWEKLKHPIEVRTLY